MHFNSSLVALLKRDLIGIREPIDFSIRRIEVYLSVSGWQVLEYVLSEEVFVVEGVEVAAFAFVGELGRVEQELAVGVGPTTVEVTVDTLDAVQTVNVDIVLASVFFKFR